MGTRLHPGLCYNTGLPVAKLQNQVFRASLRFQKSFNYKCDSEARTHNSDTLSEGTHHSIQLRVHVYMCTHVGVHVRAHTYTYACAHVRVFVFARPHAADCLPFRVVP